MLHVAECGSGPLVLLLHGFAEYWWVWHSQLSELASAGYRAVAVDLRGYGDSDKPPRGYDAWTIAGDIAGLVRALGARRAHLVGHGLGGLLAWTVAALHPRVVATVSVLGAAHPLAYRGELRHNLLRRRHPSQLRAASHIVGFQTPMLAERALTRNKAAYVETLFRQWSGRRWRTSEECMAVAARLRDAMRIPGVAHSALEYYRWAARAQLRAEGRRFAIDVNHTVPVPVLQLHGAEDTCVLPSTARACAPWTPSRARLLHLDDVGHYPHLEAPKQTSELLCEWLRTA